MRAVAALLDQQKPLEAAELVAQYGTGEPKLRNALGVCLMRAGELGRALDLYKALCVEEGVVLRHNLPTPYLVNYATVLLLMRNVSGCAAVLHQMNGSDHPALARLRAALDRWINSHGWFTRFRIRNMDHVPAAPIELGFAPGELNDA